MIYKSKAILEPKMSYTRSQSNEKKLNCMFLIDDNEIDNYINKKMVIENDLCTNLHIFDSGNKAVDFILKSDIANLPSPDIILLDLNMPGYNGFEVLSHIEDRLLEKNPKLKTIFLTTSINPSDKEEAKKYKTYHSFMNKPLVIQELIKVLSE